MSINLTKKQYDELVRKEKVSRKTPRQPPEVDDSEIGKLKARVQALETTNQNIIKRLFDVERIINGQNIRAFQDE